MHATRLTWFTWLLVILTMFLVIGNACEFLGHAHTAPMAAEHEGDDAADSHHHSAAHLASCENGAVKIGTPVVLSPDLATPSASLEVYVAPLRAQAVTLGRVPASLSGPPLFIRHAALLI